MISGSHPSGLADNGEARNGQRDRRSRVVVAGGGVGGLEAVLGLRALCGDGVRIDLISPDRHFVYRPLAVAEPFDLGCAERLDLDEALVDRDVRRYPDRLLAVDSERRIARTESGMALAYDALIVAVGARAMDSVPGAVTFSRDGSLNELRQVLRDLDGGPAESVVYAMAGGASWSLPVYELAMLTRRWLSERGLDAEVSVVTPEHRPLRVFGREASERVLEMLNAASVKFYASRFPISFEDGALRVLPDGVISTDRVVSVARLRACNVVGVPYDSQGFVPSDVHARVIGLDDVYAVGDITNFPVKQGGIAAQQADAAIATIASDLGYLDEPEPFRPVLRSLLLTGGEPFYMRAELEHGCSEDDCASVDPLWWPPAKISSRYLTPFLAERALVGHA